jgi:2-furoyl-CoA dehydrogenase FAD binding subunit
VVAAKVPLLAKALPNVGHYQTRCRGTLGGSVAHADPSAEIPLSLVTLGGQVVLRSKRGERRVAAADFFQGALTTAREPDEMVVGLVWPVKTAATGYAFEEIAQRHGDFAITAAAAAATVGRDGALRAAALGLGGVEDHPIRIDAAAFAGRPATAETATAIAEDAASKVDPMEDLQANAAYRRQLVRVLGAKVLVQAFEDARR